MSPIAAAIAMITRPNASATVNVVSGKVGENSRAAPQPKTTRIIVPRNSAANFLNRVGILHVMTTPPKVNNLFYIISAFRILSTVFVKKRTQKLSAFDREFCLQNRNINPKRVENYFFSEESTISPSRVASTGESSMLAIACFVKTRRTLSGPTLTKTTSPLTAVTVP